MDIAVFPVEIPANACPGFDGIATALEDDSPAFVAFMDGIERLRRITCQLEHKILVIGQVGKASKLED